MSKKSGAALKNSLFVQNTKVTRSESARRRRRLDPQPHPCYYTSIRVCVYFPLIEKDKQEVFLRPKSPVPHYFQAKDIESSSITWRGTVECSLQASQANWESPKT
jgi:hypothetical protein